MNLDNVSLRISKNGSIVDSYNLESWKPDTTSRRDVRTAKAFILVANLFVL
jgi:hypothetical protein